MESRCHCKVLTIVSLFSTLCPSTIFTNLYCSHETKLNSTLVIYWGSTYYSTDVSYVLLHSKARGCTKSGAASCQSCQLFKYRWKPANIFFKKFRPPPFKDQSNNNKEVSFVTLQKNLSFSPLHFITCLCLSYKIDQIVVNILSVYTV